jgi:hypothetical protein
MPSFGSPSVVGGFPNWDISRLGEGLATVVWQADAKTGQATPTPVRVYDLRLADGVR